MSSRSLEEESPGRHWGGLRCVVWPGRHWGGLRCVVWPGRHWGGLRCVVWPGRHWVGLRGVVWPGRLWSAGTNWMYLAFSLSHNGRFCGVLCSAFSQKAFNLWWTADKTELYRHVYRPWWSATMQASRTWHNVAGLLHQNTGRINFGHAPTAKVCGSWGCVRGGLEGKAKLCSTPVVNQALPQEVLMHVFGPVQPPSLKLKSMEVVVLVVVVVVVVVVIVIYFKRIVR